MKRFYSPDPFCSKGPCISEQLTHRIKSSLNLHKAISLSGNTREQAKKVGRYYYSEFDQIGQGYTSKVYKAYTSDISQRNEESVPYAIKVIPLNKSSLSSIQLLQNQIQILKTLDHPNIIKCYDIYKSKSHCYIITEYCPGGCLVSYLSKNGIDGKKILNQDTAVRIVQQIVDGVKYLQSKNIVHRDIKPANILLGINGWKIADFGFSINSNTQNKSKINVGTPLYMPIQSLTQNLYSPESDIFAVGIILYELLTGSTPWQSKSEKELIRKMQLTPLDHTPGKNKISFPVFKLLVKLCALRRKNRMSKAQFQNLEITEYLKGLNSYQIPQTSESNGLLHKAHSQIIFQRKLRQNKSMDHIQILKQKQHFHQINKKPCTGSVIFDRKDYPVQQTSVQLEKEAERQAYQGQQNCPSVRSFDSKREIFWSIKDKYLDMPAQIRSTVLKKNPLSQVPKFLTRGSTKLQLKPSSQKRQDNTRSTETKQSQVSINPQNAHEQNQGCTPLILSPGQLSQLTHIFLNQIHFCRFLFYLYKNSLYVLLNKKSQQKLSIMIFKLIFWILERLNNAESNEGFEKTFLNFSQKQLKSYFKTERYQLFRKTVVDYQQKYEKEYLSLIVKIGKRAEQQILSEHTLFQQEISVRSARNSSIKLPLSFLVFTQRNLRLFLKEFDRNIILTMDSISNAPVLSSPRFSTKSNGFISANFEGLKNLYQSYRLVGLFIQCDGNYQKFEQKSKIKVNTDYVKNCSVSEKQLEKIRELIRLV